MDRSSAVDVLQQPLNWLPSSRSILSACSELRRTSYGCGVHLSHLAASCGASAPAVCATPALAVERFAPALRTCGEAHRSSVGHLRLAASASPCGDHSTCARSRVHRASCRRGRRRSQRLRLRRASLHLLLRCPRGNTSHLFLL